MATQTPTTRSGVVPYRLTVRQVERMIEAGVFPDHARAELLGGILVQQMTKGDAHNYALGRLVTELMRLLPAGWLLRPDMSVVLGRRWRPEPDLAVVRGPWERYRARAPRAEDIALIVEVAESSYALDRGLKWRRYAAAGVPVYWIVHLAARAVEVFEQPSGRGQTSAYRVRTGYGPGEDVPVTIAGQAIGRVAVRDLLP